MINKYPKGQPSAVGPNFKSTEFDCPCDKCKETLISLELVSMLESLRALKGGSLKINSGYRCSNYQEDLKRRGYDTAKGISTHERGEAADITDGVTPGYELEDLAKKVGFKAIGVGKHFIHVDMRLDKVRKWKYNY